MPNCQVCNVDLAPSKVATHWRNFHSKSMKCLDRVFLRDEASGEFQCTCPYRTSNQNQMQNHLRRNCLKKQPAKARHSPYPRASRGPSLSTQGDDSESPKHLEKERETVTGRDVDQPMALLLPHADGPSKSLEREQDMVIDKPMASPVRLADDPSSSEQGQEVAMGGDINEPISSPLRGKRNFHRNLERGDSTHELMVSLPLVSKEHTQEFRMVVDGAGDDDVTMDSDGLTCDSFNHFQEQDNTEQGRALSFKFSSSSVKSGAVSATPLDQNRAESSGISSQQSRPGELAVYSKERRFSGLVTACLLVAHSDPELNKLEISYNDPTIATSEDLNRINCFIYKPLGMLVCYPCGIGIHPDFIKNHRRSKHSDKDPLPPNFVDSLVKDFKVRLADSFIQGDDPVTPVPGISWVDGLQCSFEGCKRLLKSVDNMRKHIRDKHNKVYHQCPPSKCSAQVLFDSNQTLYRVRIPSKSSVALHMPDTLPAINILLSLHEQKKSDHFQNPKDPALLSPFLSKYQWLNIVEGLSPPTIMEWVNFPTAGDPYDRLFMAVKLYYEPIMTEIGNLEKNTTILRWVNSTKGSIVNDPFKIPMRNDTTQRYLRTITQFFVFLLRAIDNPDIKITLTPEVSDLGKELRQLLRDSDSNQAALNDVLHELIMAILNRTLGPKTSTDCPLYKFIVFINVLPSGQIREPENINMSLTNLKWPCRASTFWEILSQLEKGDPADIVSIIARVCVAVREDKFTPFSYVMEMTHFLAVLIPNVARMPRILWKDEMGEAMSFDGHPLSTSAFRAMYRQLETETETMLFRDVLLGMKLPNLHHDHIFDDLNNTGLAYSFISDRRNLFHLHRHSFLEELMDSDKYGTRFHYAGHSTPEGGISWNRSGIREWFRVCAHCIGNLFALCHYGSGQPGRGTELSILAIKNTRLRRRAIYWYKGFVNVVTMYNKTQTNSKKERLIGRSLPPSIGRLFIIWMALVVPALDIVWTAFGSCAGDERRFESTLFTGFSGDLVSDDFSAILSSISGKGVTEYGLGYPMGLQLTRHYLMALMRKFTHGVPDLNLLEEFFNEQSGHGNDAAENYAITYSSILNVSDDRLNKFVELSKLHHRILYPESTTLPVPIASATQATQQEDRLIKSTQITEPLALSPQQLSTIASQLAVPLAPALKHWVAEGFASIITAPMIPATPERNDHDPLEVSLGIKVAQLSKVRVQPARLRELRELMGPYAHFKSDHQACALELSAQRKGDLIVILGTGGGKSLLFMMSSVNADEARLATIVIVPLIALLEDIRSRLTHMKIRSSVWKPDSDDDYDAQVILVLVDNASSPKFASYFLTGVEQHKYARVVVDEAHCILTDSHYRSVFKHLYRLREGAIPFVFLTATLPPSGMQDFLNAAGLLPGNTTLIRGPTLRKEVSFAVYQILEREGKADSGDIGLDEYLDETGQRAKVFDYIRNFVSRLADDERALVFCLTRDDAVAVARCLLCPCYHANVASHSSDPAAERRRIVENWKKGYCKILAATCSIGAGIDYAKVKLVVHYRKPRNILAFSQESGRSGRSLPLSFSIVFYRPSEPDWKLQEGQSDIGVKAMNSFVTTSDCRGASFEINLDGVATHDARPCFEKSGFALCDLCHHKVKNAVCKLGGHPATEVIQTRLEGVSQLHTRSDADTSSIASPRMVGPGPLDESSLGVQIAAASIRAQNNLRTVANCSLRQFSNRLQEFVSFLQGSGPNGVVCIPCWVNRRAYKHKMDDCKSIADGYLERGSPYLKWKSRVNLVSGQCFSCCLPQLSDIHPGGSGKGCRLPDLRPLLFSIWRSDSAKKLILEPLPHRFEDERTFIQWFLQPESSGLHPRVLNMHMVAIEAHAII